MTELTKTPRRGDRIFTFDVPFARRNEARSAGAHWLPEHACWGGFGRSVPMQLQSFCPAPYSFEWNRERTLNGDSHAPSTPTGTIVLRPHQEEAAAQIQRAHRIKRVGFVLADEVGLGKTYSAWCGLLRCPKVQRILIVCPLAITAHWRAAIQAVGDGGREVMVLNYDRLQKLFDVPKDKKPRTLKGKARVGAVPQFDAIVWDESQRIKNPDSARARFAQRLTAKAGFVLWLSATIGENPLHLGYMAPLLAQMTGSKAGDMKDFVAWCAQQGFGSAKNNQGRWVWEGTPEQIMGVHRLLFEGSIPAGLRRRPEQIQGWPEIQRIPMPMDLSGEEWELYDAAWKEFRTHLHLPGKSRNPRDAMVARLRFRQKSSLLRVPHTIAFVETLLDNHLQVGISVAFIDSLTRIQEALEAKGIACSIIHGALSADERETNRLNFQEGRARVCLFTVEEGISLHRLETRYPDRATVIHDIRWSGISMAQIEGRCHRDGMYAPAYWTYACDTIDERIVEVVLAKTRNMKSMQGDALTALDAIEGALLDAG